MIRSHDPAEKIEFVVVEPQDSLPGGKGITRIERIPHVPGREQFRGREPYRLLCIRHERAFYLVQRTADLVGCDSVKIKSVVYQGEILSATGLGSVKVINGAWRPGMLESRTPIFVQKYSWR